MSDPRKIVLAEAVEKPTAGPKSKPEPAPTQSLADQLLSPEMLQRMMQLGGGILVLGFVVWLWSIGLFENPVVVALTAGTVTLSVLAAGVAMIRMTRYQLAGTGMTLLGCLAMPLNLWLYDAQGLVTIANGGHLWVPAALCCGIYALVARALRRPSFVYAFVGGIVLTGMLFLADQTVERFWHLLPPATFLVLTGWICVAAAELFPDAGDFSKDRFGKAFQRSGLATVACGLILVLGGHISAAFASNIVSFDSIQSLAGQASHKIWALSLIFVSALGFGAQSIAGRKRAENAINTVGLGAWGVVALMDVLSIPAAVTLLRHHRQLHNDRTERGAASRSGRLEKECRWRASGKRIAVGLGARNGDGGDRSVRNLRIGDLQRCDAAWAGATVPGHRHCVGFADVSGGGRLLDDG